MRNLFLSYCLEASEKHRPIWFLHVECNNEVILDSTDVNEIFNSARAKILETMASYQLRGSNWSLRQVVNLEINTAIDKSFKGSCYLPLPKLLASKKAIMDMENDDRECFKWCITRALNPVERDSERITRVLREQPVRLNWSGIEFPVLPKLI